MDVGCGYVHAPLLRLYSMLIFYKTKCYALDAIERLEICVAEKASGDEDLEFLGQQFTAKRYTSRVYATATLKRRRQRRKQRRLVTMTTLRYQLTSFEVYSTAFSLDFCFWFLALILLAVMDHPPMHLFLQKNFRMRSGVRLFKAFVMFCVTPRRGCLDSA